MNYQEFFRGKRVTVMGLGVLGRGVGDVAFIASCGAEITVTDKKTEEELRDSVGQLKGNPDVIFHLGGHRDTDFIDTDMVIKAAGVRLDSPEIAAAHRAGVPVYMSTALAALFAREMGATLVGVTGTRGKSTVTQMIHHVLIQVGRRVHLGGNVRGVSTLALVPEVESGDVFLMELDSWQLQGFGDLKLSPDVAVFTNLMPDHQNYYQDMETYFKDKSNIYRFQKSGDVLVAGAAVQAEWIREPLAIIPLPYKDPLTVLGEHNRENAGLAAEALRRLGVGDTQVMEGLASFTAVEGRLQFVCETKGVKIYNDNNATTPEATIAALRALSGSSKNIILIMGGADKGLDMSTLLYEVAKRCKRVILLPGSGTDRIVPLMQDYSIFDSLENAVREAVASAAPGDTVLFSPAFASFGMFKNEYDRNDLFMKTVEALNRH